MLDPSLFLCFSLSLSLSFFLSSSRLCVCVCVCACACSLQGRSFCCISKSVFCVYFWPLGGNHRSTARRQRVYFSLEILSSLSTHKCLAFPRRFLQNQLRTYKQTKWLPKVVFPSPHLIIHNKFEVIICKSTRKIFIWTHIYICIYICVCVCVCVCVHSHTFAQSA